VGAVGGGVVTRSWELEAGLASPRVARDGVRRLLGPLLPEQELDIVVLLTSELVTNAVVHDRHDAVLTAALTPASVTVSVSDVNRKAPVAREEQFEGEAGHGIAVVETLASAWGVHPHAEGGRTVWFRVDRPAGTVHA
jgi:anti-sigma regulatory factor (Ser/Thr protein kinase)